MHIPSCPECGETFIRRSPGQKYCKAACENASRLVKGRPKTVICQWCKEDILVSPYGRVPKFCSAKCSRAAKYHARKWLE